MGVPPFDDPAYIGAYDNSGNFLFNISLTPDSSQVFVQGSCIPGNVCVMRGEYVTVINIPPGSPVTLAYQRCCRSSIVLNLVNPLNEGMTFFTTIDPSQFNSTPVFNHEMAAFTYVGDNLTFDASATDPDNDSLAYFLDDAINGASQLDPMPTPSISTPFTYAPIQWQSPYSLMDIMGGPAPLSIDPVTGLMSGVPGTIGTFAIAVRVDEFRNGIQINSHRKEFVISVNPGFYYDLSGNVTTGLQPLDIGKAWMIRLNLIDGILNAVDTNEITNGVYLHPQEINGIYFSKASADSNSINYSSSIPTYYGDVLFWYDAPMVNLCGSNANGIDIEMIQGINPGGPGFVGGLISQGANKLMSSSQNLEGITIILFNQLNEPVAYAVTDAAGSFGIGNLAYGDYKVFVDRLNYMVDNNLAPEVTLDATQPALNNLAFTLHDTWLELVGVVALTEEQQVNEIFLYPNPASDKLVINYNGKLTSAYYEIFDMQGRKVKVGNLSTSEINITNLSPELYALVIYDNRRSHYLKFVKE